MTSLQTLVLTFLIITGDKNIFANSIIPSFIYLARVGQCHDQRTSDVTVTEMTVIRKGWSYKICGDFNVSKDIPDGWNVRTSMQKCLDIRNQDTCDYYASSLIVTNACDEDNEGEKFYKDFFLLTTPRLSCPIKAGTYKATYQLPIKRFFTDSQLRFSSSYFGYTLTWEVFNEEDVVIGCAEAVFKPMGGRKTNISDIKMELKNVTNH